MTRMRYIRIAAGLSLKETAKRMEISQQHASRIELLDIPATVGHERMALAALLKLIDERIGALLRLRIYCKAHSGHLLENMEENEHE